VGAFRFARPEDGAFNLENRNQFLFVTTGGAAGANELGRLYSLKLRPYSPTRPATLEVVYNADEIVRAGGDIAISPEYLMSRASGRRAASLTGRFSSVRTRGCSTCRPTHRQGFPR